MKTFSKGCGFDDQTKEWVIWMNKPSGLSISNRELYHRNGTVQLLNFKNKKGVDMILIKGKLPPGIRDLNGFFIEMRKDFQKYINSKKES